MIESIDPAAVRSSHKRKLVLMLEDRTRNALGADLPLPELYWTTESATLYLRQASAHVRQFCFDRRIRVLG